MKLDKIIKKILKSKSVKIGAAALLLSGLSNFSFALNRRFKKYLKKADNQEEINFINQCGTVYDLCGEKYADYPEVLKEKQATYKEAAEEAGKDDPKSLERAREIYKQGELIKVPTTFERILSEEIISDTDTDDAKERRAFVKLCERKYGLLKEKAKKDPENLEYKKQMEELEEAAIAGLYAKDLETGKKLFFGDAFTLDKFFEKYMKKADTQEEIDFIRHCGQVYDLTPKKYADHPKVVKKKQAIYKKAVKKLIKKGWDEARKTYREGELIKPEVEIDMDDTFGYILNDKTITKDIEEFVKKCQIGHGKAKKQGREEDMKMYEEAAMDYIYGGGPEDIKKAKTEYKKAEVSSMKLVFENAKKSAAGKKDLVKLIDDCETKYYSTLDKYGDNPKISDLQMTCYYKATILAVTNKPKEAEMKKLMGNRLNNVYIFIGFKGLPGADEGYMDACMNDYLALTLSGKDASHILGAVMDLDPDRAKKKYMPRGYWK